MKIKFITTHLSAFILGLFITLGATLIANNSYGQSQSAMNITASNSYKNADAELNKVYNKILKEYSGKPIFIKNIKTAQRLWLKLRDADLAARYPEKGKYGSTEAMCRISYLESMTRERIKVLLVWLDGITEGDVCIGSVKFQ